MERGFHGTSMRDIAARSGTSVSHMYYYFPSKASVLKSMMTSIVQDLLNTLEEAGNKAGASAAERLSAIVQAQVLFHSRRQAEAFIGRSELRSLEAEDLPEIIALYDRVTGIFKTTIAEGIRLGEFKCAYRAEATNAIITMCNGVSSWYRSEGRLSPQTIAKRYAELSLQMLGKTNR